MCMMAAAILPMMLGAAQGVMQYAGQQQEYKQRMKEKRANDENAAKSTQDRYDAINLKQRQEQAKGSADAREAQRRGLAARGRERASQAEAGVMGNSAEAVLNDLYREEGEFQSGLHTSLMWQMDGLEAEGSAARATGQNQINAMPTPIAPSFAAAGIRILGSVFNNMPSA